MRFWYHMDGTDVGTLKINLKTEIDNINIWQRTGFQVRGDSGIYFICIGFCYHEIQGHELSISSWFLMKEYPYMMSNIKIIHSSNAFHSTEKN